MAAKKISWNETKEGMLELRKYDGETVMPVELTVNPVDLFPGFNDFAANQKYCVLFGLKQSLADDAASDKTPEAKIASIKSGWEALKSGAVRERRASKNLVAKKAGLEVELAEMRKRLVLYIESSDEDKRLAASFGVNRTGIEAAITKLAKDIAKVEKAVADKTETIE